MSTTIILIGFIVGVTLTVNSDLVRVYNFLSYLFFGGKKLTPKEF